MSSQAIKLKILVIDDDDGIVESLRYLLEEEGFEVITSGDGTILNKIFSGKIKPDLILMDYWLPNENGGELTRKLKANKNTAFIPVIVISASYNIKDAVMKIGADDFMPKPYDINDLLSKISEVYGNRHVSN